MTESTAPMRPSRVDQHIRPTFKELARDIVARDRFAKRHGHSHNTVGEIERALVKAHALGRTLQAESALTNQSQAEPSVDWISIPPRSRDTLISMTHGFSERWDVPNYQPYEIERFTKDGRIRWAIIRHGKREDHSIADGSAAPLGRMELIASVDATATRYALTAVGLATCREYWRRSDANDPTLPRISMR